MATAGAIIATGAPSAIGGHRGAPHTPWCPLAGHPRHPWRSVPGGPKALEPAFDSSTEDPSAALDPPRGSLRSRARAAGSMRRARRLPQKRGDVIAEAHGRGHALV